jgi:hypothetical protein
MISKEADPPFSLTEKLDVVRQGIRVRVGEADLGDWLGGVASTCSRISEMLHERLEFES